MIVQLSTRATAEFASALAFLDDQSPRAADELRLRIEAAVGSLRDFPNRGRPGAIENTRELGVRGTPYVLVYTVGEDLVRIARIRHTSQDPSPE